MRPADRATRIAVLVGWMALLTYWSGQGNLPIDQPVIAVPMHGYQHRVAHLLAFGLLGLLARWAFGGLPRSAVLAVVIASAFGASDEWHQSFTPGRRSAVDDWVTDTVAATLAVYAWSRSRQLSSTRWRPALRTLSPIAVAACFALGIGLAIRPGLVGPTGLNRATLRSATSQAAHDAIDLARSTRDVARQIRSAVS
jgi:VanZ family protein